jgi:antitoxin component YwqK of YwqJK toxin-antitoxin module
LDKDGQLFYEGDFYQDCCIGTYIKRYSNGKIKVKGQYKIPPKELIENGNLYENGYCRVHGEWIYYNINGEIEKREIYEDGKLVK